MEYIDCDIIKSFFEVLNVSGLKYALIRNTGGELPDRLQDGKDIDILVNHEDISCFMKLMKQENFQRRVPPFGILAGWQLAYQMHDFLFYKKRDTSYQLYIDVCQELCCHSVMPNIWITLDRQIQEDAWIYRRFDKEKGWWCLDDRTTVIVYLVKAIFDKRQFSPGYIESIEPRISLLDDPILEERLRLVFFRYTDRLMEMLRKGNFDRIVADYYGFMNY